MLDIILSALHARLARICDVNGEPWFAINDALAALGQPRRTIGHYRIPSGQMR